MKVIIPENRLDEFFFKYLDVKFKDLEQVKGRYVDIVFRFPDEQAGIMGWSKNDDSTETFLSISTLFKTFKTLFSFFLHSVFLWLG